MRLAVKFKSDLFPMTNSALGMCVIQEVLKKDSVDYYENLYVLNDRKNPHKNFTFSFRLWDFEKNGDEFKVNGYITMYISTIDDELGSRLYNGFLKTDVLQYKGYFLKKESVTIEEETNVTTNEVDVKLMSPLIVKTRNNWYLTVGDIDFNKELNYITNVILEGVRGYGLKEKLVVEPIRTKKIVVKQYLKEFTKKTGRDYNYMNSTVGVLRLKGDKEDLNDILKLGIGFRRSQGYGMLKVIS